SPRFRRPPGLQASISSLFAPHLCAEPINGRCRAPVDLADILPRGTQAQRVLQLGLAANELA
ncbi:hypothetical protein, partial [Bradyrhizobium sp. 168]|uniref:hypothetical protein n=1 Tax=Bradyrhizobium sp. 168 TaxID=2782639 RepID=UPI001FFA1E45